jgi:ribosomal protein S6
LSSRPEKLERIEHLLKKHEVILRIQNIKVQDKNSLPAKVRKKMSLRRIEKEILSQ